MNSSNLKAEDEKVDDKKIKVTDKRMFTADGELREDFREADIESPIEETSPAPEIEVPDVSELPPVSDHVDPATEKESARVEIPDLGEAVHKPGFADLVAQIAQPIALYLGDMPLPEGESAENLDLARVYIDLLEVLREKTMGNLSAQELSLLDDLLYQTRLRYVQKRG